jgi:hypothetical protein
MNKAGQAVLSLSLKIPKAKRTLQRTAALATRLQIQTRQLAIVQGMLRNPRKRTRPPRTGSPASE